LGKKLEDIIFGDGIDSWAGCGITDGDTQGV